MSKSLATGKTIAKALHMDKDVRAIIHYKLPPMTWWGRFTFKPYSPVWRLYRETRLIWVAGRNTTTFCGCLFVVAYNALYRAMFWWKFTPINPNPTLDGVEVDTGVNQANGPETRYGYLDTRVRPESF